MAGERQLPGIGLYGFWTLGSNGWKGQNDQNLLQLSVLTQASVLSEVAAVPASPVQGDRHILTAAPNLNAIAVYDNGAWTYLTPGEGFLVYNRATDTYRKFNGASWQDLVTFPDYSTVRETMLDASKTLADADLSGRKLLVMSSAAAHTVTVNAGLTGMEPITVVREGAGDVTFTPGTGVTINSKGGALKIAAQYSSATLIPQGATDTYYLVGDIAV